MVHRSCVDRSVDRNDMLAVAVYSLPDERTVKVVNGPFTIAAKRERVGHVPSPVLAQVECMLWGSLVNIGPLATEIRREGLS